jgi:arogenate dehydrogenase (NADP+)
MVSASLIAACMGEENPEVLKLAQAFASSGFRDTSRVGGGNPELGIMMARYNKDAVVRSLHAYQAHLNHITTLIEAENWQDLEALLASTQQGRPDFVE